jgi:hypothetical protein
MTLEPTASTAEVKIRYENFITSSSKEKKNEQFHRLIYATRDTRALGVC